MKSYMERVIAEIPLFMAHFSQCLFRPRRFLAEQLALDTKADGISKGVEFLTLAFLIALFVGQVMPEAVNPIKLPADNGAFIRMASVALYDLFMLFLSAAIAFGCLRLFGASGSFFGFFRIFAFFCGAAMVLMVFADAITNIIFIDPVVARNWIKLEQIGGTAKQLTTQMLCSTNDAGAMIGDPAVEQRLQQTLATGESLYAEARARPLYKTGLGLQALVGLVIAGWLFVAWHAYCQSQRLGTVKTVLSAVMALVLIGGASLALGAIQTGSEMMALYRSCPAT